MLESEKLEARASSDGSLVEPQAPPEFDEKETKRILRKIDVRVLPILAVLYIFAYLDRSNIGNAKIAGMTEDLDLSGNQYNIALTVFFAPYIAFEVPCNMILKIVQPSLWISTMVISWGIVMTLQGIVQSYEGLVVTRIFLGASESGFFPAALYLLGTWYCRFEIQSRMSVFYSCSGMASAFSGLLAFAISKMAGTAGLGGWRWIFIVEGIATVVLGGSLAFFLPDYPETAKFLTEEEKRFIANRLNHDGGTNTSKVGRNEKFNWHYLRAAALDWHLWVATIVYWGNSICLYSFTYTVPTIILQLGYESAIAQLLTVPVYTSGVIATISLAIWADKKRTRWPFVTFPYFLTLIGLIGLLAIPHPKLPGLTYALLFTIPVGAYPAVNAALAWVSNNLAPSWKRSIGMALLNASGNVGGIIGSNIFLEQQAPNYWLGYGFCAGMVFFSILAGFGLLVMYSQANAKRDRLPVEEVKAKFSEDELIMMGDRSPLYRYVV